MTHEDVKAEERERCAKVCEALAEQEILAYCRSSFAFAYDESGLAKLKAKTLHNAAKKIRGEDDADND